MPKFICEICESEVPSDARSCPNCGQAFASTLCPECGFSGEGSLFEDGCPKCGYKIGGSKPRSSSKPSASAATAATAIAAGRRSHRSHRELYVKKTHFSYYILGLAIFVSLAVAVLLAFS